MMVYVKVLIILMFLYEFADVTGELYTSTFKNISVLIIIMLWNSLGRKKIESN